MFLDALLFSGLGFVNLCTTQFAANVAFLVPEFVDYLFSSLKVVLWFPFCPIPNDVVIHAVILTVLVMVVFLVMVIVSPVFQFS